MPSVLLFRLSKQHDDWNCNMLSVCCGCQNNYNYKDLTADTSCMSSRKDSQYCENIFERTFSKQHCRKITS